jgi:hypothetical protein
MLKEVRFTVKPWPQEQKHWGAGSLRKGVSTEEKRSKGLENSQQWKVG